MSPCQPSRYARKAAVSGFGGKGNGIGVRGDGIGAKGEGIGGKADGISGKADGIGGKGDTIGVADPSRVVAGKEKEIGIPGIVDLHESPSGPGQPQNPTAEIHKS